MPVPTLRSVFLIRESVSVANLELFPLFFGQDYDIPQYARLLGKKDIENKIERVHSDLIDRGWRDASSYVKQAYHPRHWRLIRKPGRDNSNTGLMNRALSGDVEWLDLLDDEKDVVDPRCREGLVDFSTTAPGDQFLEPVSTEAKKLVAALLNPDINTELKRMIDVRKNEREQYGRSIYVFVNISDLYPYGQNSGDVSERAGFGTPPSAEDVLNYLYGKGKN